MNIPTPMNSKCIGDVLLIHSQNVKIAATYSYTVQKQCANDVDSEINQKKLPNKYPIFSIFTFEQIAEMFYVLANVPGQLLYFSSHM